MVIRFKAGAYASMMLSGTRTEIALRTDDVIRSFMRREDSSQATHRSLLRHPLVHAKTPL